ncbi:uncharacterized protein LOC105179634 [Sesamum indicum]|uniref:Uncharacterized protein LOC105179634 n=1 Tax=Sesamum indicum TaxID=4182 RepID=A0A6I9UM55_SESIN|nr:uncharacterized protein LOC105179634 [Sesamum indicum]
MDPKNSLSKLTRTNAPRKTHTHAIGTIHSAGDGEETPAGKEDVEEESERRDEDGCRRKIGKNSRCLEVDDEDEDGRHEHMLLAGNQSSSVSGRPPSPSFSSSSAGAPPSSPAVVVVARAIWIAWDDNFVDVDVVECGTQFIHCHVTTRAPHELIAVIVVYGANEVAERRALWGTLETKATQCVDITWLVAGDFNAVRDLSEVCGTSGDIQIAMDDFNACIENAGLLPLPMQGEWFTWHNRSATPQNLWKRLDRMMINDRWMARFPNASYSTLTPRTSDHSPMVLNGDRQQRFGGFLEAAQILVSSSRRDELYIQLEHCCRLVLTKAAKMEQTMLQQRAKMQWMKGGDQCSRVFFRKIAQRRSARRILQINDDHGVTHSELEEVINEFVTYYQNLLGGERRQTVINLRFLQPWARHVLTVEEASSLLLPVTPVDVKQAIFDIAEDKAPGPDGYSSGFFKAAWPIVGQEIIVQRLSVILEKLISPGQAAFVPGRSIGDNIMLAQELFTGYNQSRLPPRYALKVDNRKAYDTVEWDFMIAVMELFGFPSTFMKWIEVCVTTPTFFVALNGKPHGFFPGARGLRQGDPVSPYLFVLVMEVLQLGLLQLIDQDELFSFHWKCDTARVFQLGFADDVLLFCHADMDSIRVFKTGLDRFNEWSGLRLNEHKSHLIISRSAQGLRRGSG